MELTGMYLCKMYYSGALKPSAAYKEGTSKWYLSKCVENALCDSQGIRPQMSAMWRQLMAGDLVRLNTRARARKLGGWAQFRDIMSIDGADYVTACEMSLYIVVGEEFKKLLSGGKLSCKQKQGEQKQSAEKF